MITDFIKSLVNVQDYFDRDGANTTIRDNIYFKGPNVFILVCAIVIASVGLNVNSIPVIIGAMLISPVMGPILGFGFGVAIRDKQLVTDSLKNYTVMVVISILASMLYFMLSPLNTEHPTELLSRTNPTLFDVIIAFFGGIAGILETSRKNKGTVVAGAAIATALMPPLCTIGYGISILSGKIIVGALYLFLINSIFISIATFLVAKYLHFPVVSDFEPNRFMSNRFLGFVVLIIIIPSIYTAVRIVNDNNFRINVSRLIAENKTMDGCYIYDYRIDDSSNKPIVELFFAGETLDDSKKKIMYAKAEKFGIDSTQIIFRDDATNDRPEISESKIIKGVYELSQNRIQSLEDSIKKLHIVIDSLKQQNVPIASETVVDSLDE